MDKLLSQIEAMPRAMPGVYANQIDAFKDGYEAARVEAIAIVRAQHPSPSATGKGRAERETFEAWMAGQNLMVERDGDSYSLTYARRAWQAWQARAALGPSLGIDAPEQVPVALSDDFRNGIRTAADSPFYRAANTDSDSWAGQLNDLAEDILELSPDDANEWKAINKAFREGYEAGKRAHPAAQQGDKP